MTLIFSRRGLVAGASAWLATGPAWAGPLQTPATTEGPFYPVRIPNDHDNDLVRVEPAVRQAGGEILLLHGLVTDTGSQPLAGVTMEIWQCDANGIYLHPADRRFARRDVAFQGFGRTLTDSRGRFSFRTILPVPYPGRTPHIHAKVIAGRHALLTTQLYRADFPQNAGDFLFRRLTPEQQQRASMAIRPVASGDRTQWQTDIHIVVPA